MNQFLSRNQNELAEVYTRFRELLSVRSHYVLYMDLNDWELFDPNVGRCIFRHSFKHLKSFTEDLIKLRHNIVEVGCIQFSRDGLPSKSQSWSLKYLLKFYSIEELKSLCNYESKY